MVLSIDKKTTSRALVYMRGTRRRGVSFIHRTCLGRRWPMALPLAATLAFLLLPSPGTSPAQSETRQR